MKGRLCILILALSLMMPCAARASDGMEVGGLHILKTDVTGAPLEGAVMQVVRELEKGDLTDRAVEKQLHVIAGENRLVAVAEFWTDRTMNGPRVKEVTTDKNGQTAIYGLPYGTYYLVETKAPEGFDRIRDPIQVSIHRYSHVRAEDNIRDDAGKLLDNTLHIINVRYALPDTGGLAKVRFLAAGTGIVFSAAALMLLNLRKRV